MPEEPNAPAIASEDEILQCMTSIMRNERATVTERLRAAEKLGSMLGMTGKNPSSAGRSDALNALGQLLTLMEGPDADG